MYGLWSSKALMKTTNQEVTKTKELIEDAKTISEQKEHNKVKYREKDFMEEMLKCSDMVKGQKK